jgi:hypothetical protein
MGHVPVRKKQINDPAASSGVLAVFCHAGLDPAFSSVLVWIPASAGMTNSRQAAGNQPIDIENGATWKGDGHDARIVMRGAVTFQEPNDVTSSNETGFVTRVTSPFTLSRAFVQSCDHELSVSEHFC